MAFNFPYTNLHEINLDWILKQVKTFAELIPPMETATEDVERAIQLSEEAIDLATQASQGVVADGSITTSKLATDAVTTIKIHDDAVTTDKIDDEAVTTDKIGNGAVTSIKIGTGAVTTGKIADDSVTWDKLASDAQNTILKNVMYSKNVPVMTGNNSQLIGASSSMITSSFVLASIQFADPSAIVGDVTWETDAGVFKLYGTCTTATTADIILIRKGN